MTDWYNTAMERVEESKENEESEEYERELVTTGDLDAGDAIQFRFQSEGEEVETEYGDAFAWDILVTKAENVDFVEGGDEARFLTSSTRFLEALLGLEDEDLAGKEIDIIRTAEGFDTQYRITEVPETQQERF